MMGFLQGLWRLFNGEEALPPTDFRRNGPKVTRAIAHRQSHVPPERMPQRPEIPEEDSTWRHTNGGLYTVFTISNVGVLREGHPPDVIYWNTDATTGRIKWWTRPLSDWHRSFTVVDPS